MTSSQESRKDTLIEAAAQLDRPGDDAENPFVRLFYQHVPALDVATREATDLSRDARALWHFAAEREPGEPIIRLLPQGLSGRLRSVVQIVTDDMPFLVSSVTDALASLGFNVHLVIHPTLTVHRRRALRVASGTRGARAIAEALMHIELDADTNAARAAPVAARLAAVLADVRCVVAAWPEISDAIEQMAAEAAAAPAPFAADDAAETASFLRWLKDDNFVALGYREYRFAAAGPATLPGAGKGLLSRDEFPVFDGLQSITQATSNDRTRHSAPRLLLLSKSSQTSSVYRPVPMDTVVVRTFDAAGRVDGLKLLLGLFTESSTFHAPLDVPLLRQKVLRCLEQSGFATASHNGQALLRILDGFPRDEMFQIDEAALFDVALGILHLKQRPRIRLFVLRDAFERSATCLVYLPRDRYSAEIRRRFTAILEQAFAGRAVSDRTSFDESLACLHLLLATPVGLVREIDIDLVERQLADAARGWADRLRESLAARHEPALAASLLHRYSAAFPTSYTERFAADAAVDDIARMQEVAEGAPIGLSLAVDGAELRLRTYCLGRPVPLSDILPMLENLGVRVMNEIPFEVTPRDQPPAWIQEFQLQPSVKLPPEESTRLGLFTDCLSDVWSGAVENDGFNRLVLSGLSARQILLLRAYCKVLRQAGSSFSQAYMEDTANAHPHIARQLVRLFEAQFDPAQSSGSAPAIREQIVSALEQVENLDEDRILRGFLLLIDKTLRTNHFQRDATGGPKPALALKLASRDIDLLPLPRPLVEIFVYSPRMEGCHLRGGKVARGGIRWSDRKEDFRTEILGLMKAQMVKNAVIVPIGSKGGFVVKRPPIGGDREALQAEAVACYRLLMHSLLDLTDNFAGNAIVPPALTVRRDADDPYLVVAADKGTASFSDIANGVAVDRGFWLGDAFASGGSLGYDHKAMGITAKGAWEAVKRHFREMNRDIQTNDFICVGVGDMAGDVFGNGMLLSAHTRLVAAFNHMHIFIDPNPNAAVSWGERRRLFDLPRSSWADYDARLLSEGGAIFERRAKAIRLSPQARVRLGIAQESLSPQALIQALLRHDADLLWFGGIGTYVKASHESQADAGDRANDSLRIDAATLRAKVVGEGANLAVTQRARIEYALAGGRINTDAIDNSAGVDTSDHEVNIKIAVSDMIADDHLTEADRPGFLAAMTAEVEALVLSDNYLQTLAITLAEARAPQTLDMHGRLMRAMERTGRLDRGVEFLPDDEAILQRAAAKRGLTRPEIAVLLAYAKNGLYEDLVASDLPEQAAMHPLLLGYFPQPMRDLAPDRLATHRLHREIVATIVANAIVNRLGPAFIEETSSRTARDTAAIAGAFLIVCDIFKLPAVWQDIASLDNIVPATVQSQLMLAVAAVAERAVRWFLLSGQTLDVTACIRHFQPGVTALAASVVALLPASEQQLNKNRRAAYVTAGAPADLANRILVLNALSTAMDIVQISETSGREMVDVAKLYYGVGVALGLLTLRRQARQMAAATEWQRLVVDTLIDESYAQQRELVRRLVAEGVQGETGLATWVSARAGAGSPLQAVLADIARAATPDLAMLTVASQRIRAIMS